MIKIINIVIAIILSVFMSKTFIDVAVCRAALWFSSHNVLHQRLTIFSSEYYQLLVATYSPAPERWKAELA